jgi:hypothetical protein
MTLRSCTWKAWLLGWSPRSCCRFRFTAFLSTRGAGTSCRSSSSGQCYFVPSLPLPTRGVEVADQAGELACEEPSRQGEVGPDPDHMHCTGALLPCTTDLLSTVAIISVITNWIPSTAIAATRLGPGPL